MKGQGLIALLGYIWRRKYRVATVVFGLAFAVSVAWWQTGLAVSDVPLWGWVAIATAVVTTPYAVMVSAIVVGLIYNPDRVILHELDAANGDVAVHDISTETYEDMIVVNANGKEIGKGHLQKIDVLRASEAYEVNVYDPDSNVAEVSWMGEASNYQIRRHESMLERVQSKLSPLANAYEDLHAAYDMDVKEKSRDMYNSLMAVIEGVELPPGETIHDELEKAGSEDLGRLPDPEEHLSELEEPERRESRPSLEQSREPTQSAPDTEGGGDV